jgi:N-glycosylase/DNA lyase
MTGLSEFFLQKYVELKPQINLKLEEYASVSERDYFYEMCFCLMTPQSRAENAFAVEMKLRERNFREKAFDPTSLLEDRRHYIRFHNQKAKRLLALRDYYPEVMDILNLDADAKAKRNLISKKVVGYGLKEASHFMRNIGYRDLAILDRHILKHMRNCGIYDEIPKITSTKRYYEIEEDFLGFAGEIGIPIDELDLLFWSYETGAFFK